MKIEEITVTGYGPLADIRLKPGNFDCLYGLNESGKTALVEVLNYALFKRTTAALRYDKPKKLEVKIKTDHEVYILPDKKKRPVMPPTDIAGLLYIKASESEIFDQDTQTKFWDRLKTMFASIGKGITFSRLDAKIFEAVQLQPKELEWKKEKQQLIEQDHVREQNLGNYIKKIKEVEIQKNELLKLSEERQYLQNQFNTISDFRKYSKFKELSKLFEEYSVAKTELKDYERYKDEYLAKWQELSLQKNVRQEDEDQLKQVKTDIIELEKDIMELKRREDFIEVEGFKECITRAQEEIRETSLLFPSLTALASFLLLLISFFTVIPRILALTVFIISILLLMFFIYKKKAARAIIKTKQEWLKKAQRIFPDITTLNELADRIGNTQKMKIEKTTLLDEKKRVEQRLTKEYSAVEIDRELKSLRDKTGLAELADLKTKLQEKNEIANKVNEAHSRIYGLLSEKDERKWEKLIERMRTKPPEHEPDLSQEEELTNELTHIIERIDELEKDIEVFNRTMRSNYNVTDNHTAFVEYNKIKQRLRNYEIEKNAALTARQILKEMSSELDEHIQQILKGKQSLSDHFQEVTDRYKEVKIKNKNFMVLDKNGHEYAIDKLSSGAQDQLLLCFRMAALKKLYPQGVFIILDDAFIFADWPRRHKLVELLKQFSADNNQVIYLTSDDHTRDLFQNVGARITNL